MLRPTLVSLPLSICQCAQHAMRMLFRAPSLVNSHASPLVMIFVSSLTGGQVIQAAAQSFGISDTLVHVAETATDRVPNSSPTAASMSTDLYCMAALDACEQIKERLRPIAAKMPGVCCLRCM